MLRAVVAHRDQGRDADRDRIGAEGERLRHVCPGPDPAGDDELHLAMHAQLLQRLHRERNRRQGRNADMLDEDILRRGRSTLHAVDDDHIGACLHRELHVVIGARRADLDEDRLLPVRDLAQLADLDLEVVGARPVGVPAGAPLVDPLRQVAHRGDAVGDLVAEEHPPAAGLRALPDDDLDRVRAAEVVRVHPVPRGQELVHERLRALPLLLGHAAVAGRRRSAHLGRRTPERLFRGRRQCAEAHAGNRDRDLQLDRLAREPRAENDVGRALLAVALERVARDARAEQQEIVEVRQPPLRAEAPDVVDALSCSALDLGDHGTVVEERLAKGGIHQYAPALSILKL